MLSESLHRTFALAPLCMEKHLEHPSFDSHMKQFLAVIDAIWTELQKTIWFPDIAAHTPQQKP